MNRHFLLLVLSLIFLLMLFLISCSDAQKTSISSSGLEANLSADSPSIPKISKEEWRTKWDNVVNRARKEGQVVVYSSLGAEPRIALTVGFKKKYGLGVEFFAGRGDEIAVKLISENRAGIRLADVYLGGNTTTLTQIKPLGLMASLPQFLILPEVLEPDSWFNKRLSYSDPEKSSLPFAAYAVIPLAINTDMVRPDEIRSYKDLLHAKWKGKIIVSDPTIAGGPAKWFGVMIEPGKLGIDYMRALVSQAPVITRDRRLELEWVARGKYAILIGPKSEIATEFTRAGAPVNFLTPVEGSHWTAGSANVSLMKYSAHPDAGVLFTNWLLSKEGQEIFVKSSGLPSARIDVSIEGVDPLMLLKPGVEYFDSNIEPFILKQPEQMKLAREIFGPLIK